MYKNLSLELRRKNITQSVVASVLNCTERTVTNKLNGTTSFSIDEAFTIHKNILPEFTMEYLFATDAEQSA